jgi:hypothetical protein
MKNRVFPEFPEQFFGGLRCDHVRREFICKPLRATMELTIVTFRQRLRNHSVFVFIELYPTILDNESISPS